MTNISRRQFMKVSSKIVEKARRSHAVVCRALFVPVQIILFASALAACDADQQVNRTCTNEQGQEITCSHSHSAGYVSHGSSSPIVNGGGSRESDDEIVRRGFGRTGRTVTAKGSGA